MITYLSGGRRPYSTDFLEQMHNDLRQLAADRLHSGGTDAETKALMRAVYIVRKIELENME